MRIGQALSLNGHGRGHSLEGIKSRAEHAAQVVAGLPVEVIHTTVEEYRPPEPIGLLFVDTEQDDRPGQLEALWGV